MPLKAIVCDWNGTVIGYRNELPLLEGIAVDIFKAWFPFHPGRMVRILRARTRLRRLYVDGPAGGESDFVSRMFAIYNEGIIRGVPVSWIERFVNLHAEKAETQEQLDRRVLRALRDCKERGLGTGILSAGFEGGIRATLRAGSCEDCFDFIVADRLHDEDGRAVAFGLNIYRHKREYLERLLDERGLAAQDVAYIGDSDDDEGCFDLVGYPIVALLAEGEFKERCADLYGAFVPLDEADLLRHLCEAAEKPGRLA